MPRYGIAAPLALLALASPLFAADGQSRRGHGHVAVSYQYIKVDGFESSVGELPIGTTHTQTLNFEIEYHMTERWTILAGIPLIRKRYNGPAPHDPRALDPPRPDIRLIDDGDYHTQWQDLHLGVRYLARTGPLSIEPYAALGVPSNDYPFFGHAAVGQNLTKLDLGLRLSYRPPLSDVFMNLDVSHVFVEETLGVNIDHWRVNADIGYVFADRFSARVFALLKDGHGLTFPDDFPPPRTTEKWLQHDRMVKHNYANAGVGADWLVTDSVQVSLAAMTMVWAEQVHILEYATLLTVSYGF